MVNLYGTGSYTSGDSIFLGAPFWFAGGPNVVMNLYDNSQVNTRFFAWGGHLNIYGGTVTVNDAVLSGTPTGPAFVNGLDTDATRLMNIAGGQLNLAGDATAPVNDWIARGILQAYGGAGTINIDTISSPGRTIVTAVPEPSAFVLLGLSGLLGARFLRRRSIV